jgi:MFS family permease
LSARDVLSIRGSSGQTAGYGLATLDGEHHSYDRIFWLAYLSNGLTTLANGMLVRYSDFVHLYGGDERQLGWIVGCGMIGSILFRLAQGDAVDRYGASRVWFWSVVIYSFSLLMHLWLGSANGPGVFLARIMMQASLAGVFSSSITFVALRARPERMAEVIGMLGTSGFIGLMLGPAISDWLGSGGVGPAMVRKMFGVSAALALTSAIATFFAARGCVRPTAHVRPNLFEVVIRHQPWLLSITAAVTGAGFSIPMTFLRPFAMESKLGGIALFFLVYAGTGFAARLASRSLFSRYGNRPWICLGLTLLTISYFAYVPIATTWHLIFPAMIAGAAHALLFPTVMSEGTRAFPRQYLGVATALMLTMFDVGTLISAPLIGLFLHSTKAYTAEPYKWLFAGIAALFACHTTLYCVLSAAVRPRDGKEAQ